MVLEKYSTWSFFTFSVSRHLEFCSTCLEGKNKETICAPKAYLSVRYISIIIVKGHSNNLWHFFCKLWWYGFHFSHFHYWFFPGIIFHKTICFELWNESQQKLVFKK